MTKLQELERAALDALSKYWDKRCYDTRVAMLSAYGRVRNEERRVSDAEIEAARAQA